MTYSYGQSVSGSTRTVTVTDPLSHVSTTTADTVNYQLLKSTDGNQNTTTNSWDPTTHLLTTTTFPEGNSVGYGYDARGNVTSVTRHTKPGSGLGDTATTASYPASCSGGISDAQTCNKPTWTRDEFGNQTDYAYTVDQGTGTITQMVVTGPTPGANAANRPITTYTWSKPNSTSVWRPSKIMVCRTIACSGAERTDTWYSNFDNNLNVIGMHVSGSDGSSDMYTQATYDAAGNQLTATDANGNTTRTLYNKDREVVGTVGADPDGQGGNWAKAWRITYDPASGWVSKAEEGTAPGQADSDWQNFSSHREVDYQYDTAGRKVRETAKAGSTSYAETQYSYDGDGRLDCTALRMSPGAYGSTASACDAVSSAPWDRIGRNEYDAANQVTKVWTGYRSPQASAVVMGYTADGKLQDLYDGNGNQTHYVYDGFDRLTEAHYPNPSGGGYSTSDYAAYIYDAHDNLTRRYLRKTGKYVDYSYNKQNRLYAVTSAALTGASDPNLSFGYDQQGHVLSTSDSNGDTVSFSYNALGRKTSETNARGSVSMEYDAGGRRTKLKWSDGNFVTYAYDHADHMTGIFENGGTQLVSFGYDDDGRRTSRSFANGTSKTYGYDAVSRLSSFSLNGTSYPNTITLDQYDPAGDIGRRSQSNNAYVYAGDQNASKSYSPNGLNQYAAVNGQAQGYDEQGNMTSSGGNTYQYNSRNELVVGSQMPYGLYYDPIGRLDTISAESLHLGYDGDQLVTEYSYANNSNNVVARRYVFGPAGDEPLIAYEGSDLSQRRYLDADERGSIVRYTTDGGGVIGLSYNEYGVPASSNPAIRFQYTGQAWIPALGLYNYKARLYSPTLGRFMQTDPVGYADGPNWYNYVGSNPVNGIDPSGMTTGSLIDSGPGLCGACSGYSIYFGSASKGGVPGERGTGRNLSPDDGTVISISTTTYYQDGQQIGSMTLEIPFIGPPETSGSFGGFSSYGAVATSGQNGDKTAALDGAIIVRAARAAGIVIGVGSDIPAIAWQQIYGYPTAAGMLPETVLMANNNKQIRKRISGLQAQIDTHQNKLNNEPDSPASSHWQVEIKAWVAEIERLRGRLPNGQ